MLYNKWPVHDINELFTTIEKVINEGGVDDKTREELLLINALFEKLPPEAIEYGMRFLWDERDLPPSTDELIPLFIRFTNLTTYIDKIIYLRDVPSEFSDEAISSRQELISSLEDHEKMFAKPILGYKFNKETLAPMAEESNEDSTSPLFLMNASAPVFRCKDMIKTCLYYEEKLGFKSVFLDDEAMPHIKLTRDNLVIILVEDKNYKHSGPMYDLFIYVSEPYLLYSELQASGAMIIESLSNPEEASQSGINRHFAITDIDGHRICISQFIEEQ